MVDLVVPVEVLCVHQSMTEVKDTIFNNSTKHYLPKEGELVWPLFKSNVVVPFFIIEEVINKGEDMDENYVVECHLF